MDFIFKKIIIDNIGCINTTTVVFLKINICFPKIIIKFINYVTQ